MNSKYISTILLFFTVFLIHIFIFPIKSFAQYPVNDTLRKIIVWSPFTKVSNDTHIRFDDPENRPNHIELSLVNGNPDGIKFYYTSLDSVNHRLLTISGKKPGEYLVKLKYRCQATGCEADSGEEFVHISVLTLWGAELHDSTYKQAPDISKVIPVDINVIEDLTNPHSNYSFLTLFTFTPTKIYQINGFHKINPYDFTTDDFWEAPKGKRIIEVSPSQGEPNVINILLDDGTIYRATYRAKIGFAEPIEVGMPPNKSIIEQWIELKGDALYLRSDRAIYVTRDYCKTWEIDTNGLNGAFMYSMALDSSQNVYLATSSGLFKQGTNDNTWSLVNSLSAKFISSLFIDRLDRIFAISFNGLYLSSDKGKTWLTDTSGLSGLHISNLGDDAYGNIYATTLSVSEPNKLLRSSGGTGGWTEIAQTVRALAVDNSNTNLFHSVTGDSAVLIGTLFGLFRSTDRGVTWSEANISIPSTNFYYLIKNEDGSIVLSSNRGLYKGTLNDSASWQKIYPVNGYMNGTALFKDNNGILYTLGPSRTENYNTLQPVTYISSDNGNNWLIDSSGISSIPSKGLFFVDGNGEQHLALQLINAPLQLFKKAPGSPWVRDENGFVSVKGDYAQSFGFDKQGNLYFSISNGGTKGILWKRNLSGVWSTDTLGMNEDIIYLITPDKNGGKYGVGYSQGILYSNGINWGKLRVPDELGKFSSASAISVDSSGALFAAFTSGEDNTSVFPNKVYFTTDNGNNWYPVGLDSVIVSKLISFGDTTYALTNEGIFSLTRTPATGVKIADSKLNTSEFSVYPNPNDGEAVIVYSLKENSNVRIELFNNLGQKILTITNEVQNQGTYEKKFNTKQFLSGSYFLRLSIDEYSSEKLMLVVK
ncbi:MAG: T9SS type A sorting domain-containing protein [Bacteroidetes bacterium]|nr:MAG: T9SS type A sorting domain-containing protein [Bacteroidota bacterium]